jgi:HSP20 family protein
MDKSQSIRLKQLQGRLGTVVYEFTKIQFSHYSSPAPWQPAINTYRCRDSVVICVDLAGVNREEIDLRVEPHRLTLRGQRQPPEPIGCGQAMQILALEIDYGPFERELTLTTHVDPERVTAEQRNGLLWIYLPIRGQA